MAFYRNYTNEVVRQSDLDEKGQNLGKAAGDNGELEATSSDNEVAVEDNSRLDNVPPPMRRTAVEGKWGSNFWKDCQPMGSGGVSDSAEEEMAQSGSEYKNEEGSEDEASDAREQDIPMLEDDDRGKELRKNQSVPLDEMLSDEYYEQDGDDQSELLHRRVVNQSTNFSSKPLPRHVGANKGASRKAKASEVDYDDEDNDDGEGVDDDADYEEDDDDEADGMYIYFHCIFYYNHNFTPDIGVEPSFIWQSKM